MQASVRSSIANEQILNEIAGWEQKKELYIKAVTPILRKWQLKFDSVFSGYTEELTAVTKSQGFSKEVQEKILAREFEKFERCKLQLFQLNQNASVKVVNEEIADRKRAIDVASKVTLVQSAVRRWLALRTFKSLQKNDRQRNKAAFELLETEKTYVKNLDILFRVFLTPLRILSRGPEPLIAPENLTKIFSNCEMLTSIHTELLASLEERMKKWSKTQVIGDVFEKWAPYLKLYIQYVTNFDVANATLVECKKNDAIVEEFFKDARNNPDTGKKDFADFQIMPVQRIPRYELLFKEIIKYTDPSHPDYKNLTSALSKIQAVATKINETKRFTDNLEKILSIQAHFAGKLDDLVQPHRKYLTEGIVHYDIPKPNTPRVSRRPVLEECYAFLLTDIIILCQKKAGLLDGIVRFNLITIMKLLYVAVEPLDNYDSKFGFSVIANHTEYPLYFDTQKMRDSWIDLVTKTASDLEKNLSTLKVEEVPEVVVAAPPSPTLEKPRRLSVLLTQMTDHHHHHSAADSPSIATSPTPASPALHATTGTSTTLLPPVQSTPYLDPRMSTNLGAGGYVNLNNSGGISAGGGGGSGGGSIGVIGVPTAITATNPTHHHSLPASLNSNTAALLGSPPLVPPASSKMRQVLKLYEEVYQLELAIFQVPVDLKSLFPTYYQQLPPNYQQLLWSRVFVLKQKLEQADSLHDNVLAILKSPKFVSQLEKAISDGKGVVGDMQNWIKENFPPNLPQSQQPRTLTINLVKWLQSLLKLWEQIQEENI